MRVLFACASLLLVACGSSHGGGGGNFACPSGMDGILVIDWSVRGLPASTASCSGIDKISLFLNSQLCGQVEISPINCAMDKLRYDKLPDGPGEVVLQGVDARGALVVSGAAMVDLTSSVPAQPTPVALQ